MAKKEKGRRADEGLAQYVENRVGITIQFNVGSCRWCQKRCRVIIGNLVTKTGMLICKRCEDQSFKEKDDEQKEIPLCSELNT